MRRSCFISNPSATRSMIIEQNLTHLCQLNLGTVTVVVEAGCERSSTTSTSASKRSFISVVAMVVGVCCSVVVCAVWDACTLLQSQQQRAGLLSHLEGFGDSCTGSQRELSHLFACNTTLLHDFLQPLLLCRGGKGHVLSCCHLSIPINM